MASTVRTNRRRRLRLAVAGAVVLTTLTAATAGAALPPADGEAATAAPPQRAANPATGSAIGSSGTADNSGTRAGGTDAKPRSLTPGFLTPGFLLERGRYTTLAAPGAMTTVTGDINNRGQVVGFASTDGTQPAGSCWPGGSTDRSPRSASPARPAPWRSASTTSARSPAPTTIPMPRPARNPPRRRRWAG